MSVTYPIIQLTVGAQTLEFARAEVLSANLVEQVNPISAELPISTLEFSIINSDDTFSMFGGGLFALLSERLPIVAYERVDTETRLLGKYFLDTWKHISETEFAFTAIDIIGVMAATVFDGIFWSTPVTLADALAQVLAPINVAYTLDAAIEDVEISGWIPPTDYREALQQICFAAGAAVSTSRRQDLLVSAVDLPELLYDSRIRDTQKGDKQTIELLPLIASIELVSHNYTQGTDLVTIYEESLAVGSHKIVFGAPYYNIIVDGPGYVVARLLTEGGDLITTEGGDYIEAGGEFEFGPNSIFLTLTEAGTVTITGYPWLDSKRSFIFNETGVSEFANKTTLKIEDATLVSVANGQAALDRVRDYYRQRYIGKVKLLPTEIKPQDIVMTNATSTAKFLGAVQRMAFDLTGGFLADAEALGIEPDYAEPVASPARRARTGIAISGVGLTRQNAWREYAHT